MKKQLHTFRDRMTRVLGIGLLSLGLLSTSVTQAQNVTAVSFPATFGTTGTLATVPATTTIHSASGNDDNIGGFNSFGSGFVFTYAGVPYAGLAVSPDGFLKLGSAGANQFTNDLASTTNTPIIAPYWDDLATGTNGSVRGFLTGTAPNRIYVIDWFVTIPRATAGAANANFQCWLYENGGRIDFVYGSGIVSNGSYSVGLALTTGTPTRIATATINGSPFTSSSFAYVSAAPNNLNNSAIPNGSTISFIPSAPSSATTTITGGNWNDPATWVGGVVPNPWDTIRVVSGSTLLLNQTGSHFAGQMEIEGTVNFASTASDLTVNKNLIISSGGTLNVFEGTTGKTLVVRGNLTNDGTIDLSKTGSVLNINGGSSQTIGGAGTVVSSTIPSLTFNNVSGTRDISFNWANINVSSTLTFTSGWVNLGTGNSLSLGTSGSALGTLNFTAGNGFTSGKFTRWFGTTGTGTTLTASTIPTFGAGSFPFILGNGNVCHFHRATAALTTAGTMSVEFTPSINTTATAVPPTESSLTFDQKTNATWAVTTGGGYASSATHSFAIQAQGTYTAFTSNARLLINETLFGTHLAGTSQPMVQRSAVDAANIVGTYTLGVVGSEVPNITVASGAWDNPATWSAGVPSCGQNVVVSSADSVWLDGSMLTAGIGQISINGKLSVQGSTLNVGCTNKNNLFNVNGTLRVSGGTVNINGNLILPSGSVFAHTGGAINIDGNDLGLAATSVASGTPLVNIATGNLTLSGGVFTIVDPHTGTVSATNNRAFYYTGGVAINNTAGWTLQFGDGLSTDSGGVTANAGFVLDMAGSKIVIDSLVINAGISGVRRFVTLNNSTTFGCNNMYITADGEGRISSATYIAKNLVNNGRLINTAGAVTFGTFLSSVAGTSSNAQTISGTGGFRNSLTASTASFTTLTINNNNPSGVTFAADSVLLGGTNTGTVSGTFTLTNGIVNTVSDTFVLGVSATTTGTLTYTNGGFSSGSRFSRWWGTAIAGQTITAGAVPTAGVGTYPFVTIQTSSPLTFFPRHAYIRQTVAAGAGGQIVVSHNDVAGLTAATIVDGAYTVETRTNTNWTVGTLGLTGTPTYTVAISAAGTYEGANGNSRIVQAATPVNGAHQNGTNLPHIQRTGLALTDMSGTWYAGAANNDIAFYTVTSGNWQDGSTWNKGVAPSCSDSVVVRDGHIVTVNSVTSNARAIGINLNGKLVVSGSSLTVGCTMNNASIRVSGNLTVSGGTLTINGGLFNNPSGRVHQSGGAIVVDGNDSGKTATSISNHVIDMYAVTDTSLLLTGGTITIVDPAVAAAGVAFKVFPSVPVNFSTSHTVIFGDGVSNQPGGTNAFNVNLFNTGTGLASFGNVVVNSPWGTNRFVNTTNTVGIIGNLTVTQGNYRMTSLHTVKGNIVNNDTLINTSTLTLADPTNAITSTNTTAQSISGTGRFLNAATGATAGTTSLTIRNSSVGGVTISARLSVSGTLTLTRGIVNTNATDTFRLGTITAAATLSGGHDSAYINGPFSRTFPASRTATGTYTTAATLFPVGKFGRYLPIFVDPTTNAGGRIILAMEADTTGSGTLGSGATSMSSLRWQSNLTDAANFVSAFMRLTDTASAFTSSTKLLTSTTASGAYTGAPVTITYAAGPPKTITTGSQLLAADFTGHYKYGELVTCSTPANQPTSFVTANLGSTAFDGSFTAAIGGATHYLVVRYATGGTEVPPVDFTSYAVNATLGTGTVVANTTGTSFTQTGLTAATGYDYYVYAYNNSGCFGPVYNTAGPLLATVTTCASTVATPVIATAVNVTNVSITPRWSNNGSPTATYLVDISTSATFTSFLPGYQSFSTGSDTFVVVTGVSAATTYYYRVRALDGGCSSLLSGTQSVTTLCNPITSLPWTEGFESLATGTNLFPSCWNFSNTLSSWFIATDFAFAGTKSLRRSWSTDGWAFTPTMTLTAGTPYVFSYYVRTADATTPAYDVTVGVGTAQNAAAMTTTLSTVTNFQSTTWTKVTHTFIPVSTADYSFGIRVVAPVNPNGINFDEMRVEEMVLPTVITGTKSSITQSSANLSGTITSAGGGTITTAGIVVGTSPNPVIGGPGVIDSVNTPTLQSGTFTESVLGLTGATVYYYRAYATNAVGTSYGDDSTFTTLAAPVLPAVNTIAATAVTVNSATIGGDIVSNGGDAVTLSGIVYSTSPSPAIGGLGVVDSVTTPLVSFGSFTINPTGLTPSTKYYYRAYAINSVGTAYGVEDSFTTAILINSFPYTQNFELGTAGWVASANGGNNPWQLGTPSKTYLNGAYSGTNAWVTTLSGNYAALAHDGVVTSPQIDLTTVTNPVLRFKHKFDTDADINWDGGVIEISINGGPWTRLDNTTGTGANFNTTNSYAWYNNGVVSGTLGANKFNGINSVYASVDGNNWIESATPLTGAAGQSNVKVRFRFWADAIGVDEGWEFDDVEIVDITTPATPASAVNLTAITNTGATVNWTNGDGQGRLVVARLTSTAAVPPTNNVLYNASTVFGAADSTGLGNYIVYKNSASSVVTTGLAELTDYTYDVYEYNGKYMHIRFASAASNNGTTLPVTLTNFTATAKAKDALLNWTTASETNNRGFNIERSLDGRSFETVGFVKGAGNSNRNLNYAFTDVAAFTKSGVWYYRLKQVDFDGKFSYSQIVKVSVNAVQTSSATVYPNPFKSDYTLSFSSAKEGVAQVELMDMQGRVVSTTQLNVAAGLNAIPVSETAQLHSGVYFLKVTINGEAQTIKLVKE